MHSSFTLGLIAALGASSGAAATANGTSSNGTSTNGPSGASSPSPLQGQPPSDPRLIIAHPDDNCMQPLGQGAAAVFNNTKQYPDFNTTMYPVFPGAESQDGGGYDVWFNMAAPEPTCRNIIMIPFSQDTPWPNAPVGKQLINAGKAGCYFAKIPQDTELYMSECCGDACAAASMNASQLLASPLTKKRDMSENTSVVNHYQKGSDTMAVPFESASVEAKSGSMAARANAIARRWYYSAPAPPNCHFITPGEPYSRAGPQIVVSASETCQQAPCSVGVSYQTSYSITASSSYANTITDSFGVEFGVQTGVDFFATAQFSASAKYDFSNAVEQSTGKDVMDGNSTTLVNTVSLELGVESLVTFTPTYLCYTGTYDCAKNTTSPFFTCFPDVDPSTGQPRGDYSAVSFG